MSSDVVIRAEGLVKIYRTDAVETLALRGVDLSIHKGEFTAVAGPSGSGKSTLLHLLGGLDRPTSGEVFLEGKALSKLHPEELARLRLERIGFVFQAHNLIPVLTVLENVTFALELRGVPARERERRAREVLAELGIEKYAQQFPHRLSGGEQQRVAVARAVVGDPAVVLADEPTASLDGENSRALIDLMRRLNETRGTTFFFATHDARLLDRVKRLLILEDGRIVSERVQA
ncbi:ABC transporter ATP-binding protein [Candidatus Bipolaricaulota bacterium]|nr:ABC transporter ATP-binding protein [Candidatus Bipolaricaulota bacterium]